MAFLAPVVGFIGAHASLIGAGLGAVGAVYNGIQANTQANYQAQIARNNAMIAERNANIQAEQAQRDQVRSDRQFADTAATQMAAQSASGLDTMGRSQLQVRQQTQRVRGEQALDIRHQGETATARLFQDSTNFQADAVASKMQGKSALVGSVFQAGSSLIGAIKPKKVK